MRTAILIAVGCVRWTACLGVAKLLARSHTSSMLTATVACVVIGWVAAAANRWIGGSQVGYACRYGARPGMAGKEPGARFLLLPILPEQRQEFRGQHDVPLVLAFALPPPQAHARAVDIRDLQLAQFRHSQPRRIERGEDGPMFQVAWGGQ